MDHKDHALFFHQILTMGSKANTYKFALARFLLDYSKNLDMQYINKKIATHEGEKINYSEIAKHFLKYYWHQECKFKIIQNHDPKKIPNVIKIIRKIFGTEYIPDYFSDMKKEKIQQAEKEIIENVFGKGHKSQVVPRFQNIKNESTRKLFYDYDDVGLVVYPEALEFFHENYNILFKAVILEWAKFVEKINTLPRIISKIESEEIRRRALSSYKQIFREFSICFYCPNVLKEGEIHVDHFIPWSYIFEDEAWNLVLACKDCNLKKSDRLAPRNFLEELILRNKRNGEKIEMLGKSLRGLSPEGKWETEIRRHYRNCKDYGFREEKLP